MSLTGRDPAATCTKTVKATGARCTAYAMAGTDPAVCVMHSDRAAAARASRKPAQAPDTPPPADVSQPLPMGSYAEVQASMAAIVEGMRTGQLSARTGSAMTQAARVALVALAENRDRRIEELERAVAAQRPTQHRRR
jgi:hypothetical protein